MYIYKHLQNPVAKMVKDELIGVIWRGRDTYSDREVVCDLIGCGYNGRFNDKVINMHRKVMESKDAEHLQRRSKDVNL